MPGTLFLVAVPIGNTDDLSLRARQTLRAVDVVAAEDTRHFATLARHHDIGTRAVSYHDHNEESRTRELIGRLRAGEDVALVSDAGTPLVSDPGYRLVRAAIEEGVNVTSLPGPSAVTTALAASGLPPHPFRFIGFLPRTAAARRSALEGMRGDEATLIAFEAPRRLAATLRDALVGARRPARMPCAQPDQAARALSARTPLRPARRARGGGGGPRRVHAADRRSRQRLRLREPMPRPMRPSCSPPMRRPEQSRSCSFSVTASRSGTLTPSCCAFETDEHRHRRARPAVTPLSGRRSFAARAPRRRRSSDGRGTPTMPSSA